ncbi:hypothetical protein ES319_A13G204900v1 [Gossypium barbadense]|uniref:Reticulon domain-containing protein n=1 Tax=Gossypium barbadense TaxID=3634 RepID=A0A5J5T296_GOSBA|nr:hypothetical protein ES319_A13G204900v1 [Gossypium barbadense]
MDLSYRRLGVKSSVVAAGSVWETRMKSDEFRGGIKVFNGEDEDEEEENINGDDGDKRLKKGQTVGGSKRKTWKNESFDGFKKNPIKVVAKGRSMEHCKDLSLAVVDNGIKKKSPVQVKKGRSDGNERNPILTRKQRSQVHKRTAKTDSNGNEDLGLDSIEENEKNPVKTDKVESETEENNEEHGVCQVKTISSSADNGDTVKSSPEPLLDDDDAHSDGDGAEDDEEQIEEENGIEVENEKKSFDIKEMNVQEDKKLPKIDTQVKKSPEEKPNKAINEMKKVHEDKGSNVVNQVKKFSQFHNKTATFSSTMNKQPPPVVKLATSIPTKSKPSSNDDHHYHKFPQTQNKLQNIVDLVMWRDIPKSALIFGIGTFIIISSSYTQDLNIRSIICRGVVEIDESNCVVGEEEAIWLLKLVLPYLNEFLLQLRALFSGDPSTTMKMAVLLFVLARCGSSITIWKMAKLGFFGVFIVPKLCTSYSHQLTAYGKFWIGRFRDAWESCTHKKAVAMVLFTLVWNLCSTLARIWAAFMLFVALRYYQQKMTDEWMEREEGLCGSGSSVEI